MIMSIINVYAYPLVTNDDSTVSEPFMPDLPYNDERFNEEHYLLYWLAVNNTFYLESTDVTDNEYVAWYYPADGGFPDGINISVVNENGTYGNGYDVNMWKKAPGSEEFVYDKKGSGYSLGFKEGTTYNGKIVKSKNPNNPDNCINYYYELPYNTYGKISEYIGVFYQNEQKVYSTYTLTEGDSITIRNNTIYPSVLIDVIYNNATFNMVRIYEGMNPLENNYENITDYEIEEIEYNQEFTIWKVRNGSIVVSIEEGLDIYVNYVKKDEGGGDIENPFDYINPPKRSDYDAGLFGGIQYGIDTVLYTIGFPFIALTYLCEKLVVQLNTLLSGIGQMNSAMAGFVSWMPAEYIAMLVLGIVAGVILKILGR